ncbi:MAG: VOC family protein [Chloroflexi bacterium]|nr:VOC family protein [Chloroflexota bacterium]
MLKRVHHIGYSVHNVEEAIAEFERLFGSRILTRATTSYGKPLAFVSLADTQVEFLETSADPGMHLDHIAYEVDDAAAEVATLKAKGAETTEANPSLAGSRSARVTVLGSALQLYQALK